MSIHVFGLARKPGPVALVGAPTGLGRRWQVSVVDVLAAACLDASADVLVAHGPAGCRAVPLHDVIEAATARFEWSARQPPRLVVPRWVEPEERLTVVALQAVTFADFLRTQLVREWSEG